MTPPEHFLVGISIANIFYSLQSLLQRKSFNYLTLILTLGAAAILPDIDSFFGSYTSKDPFIGHRGITHSILANIVFGLILSVIAILIISLCKKIFKYTTLLLMHAKSKFLNTQYRQKQPENLDSYISLKIFFMLLLMTFIAGFSHLLADLPQPPSVWNGIPIFFPLKIDGQYVRNGGWSLIGWYDFKILWILIKASIISLIVICILHIVLKFNLKRISLILFCSIIIINLYSLIRIIDYIKHSKYINSAYWEKTQMIYLNNSHPAIKRISLEGKKTFLKIFNSI